MHAHNLKTLFSFSAIGLRFDTYSRVFVNLKINSVQSADWISEVKVDGLFCLIRISIERSWEYSQVTFHFTCFDNARRIGGSTFLWHELWLLPALSLSSK